MIEAQVPTMPSPARFSTISNAFWGMRRFSTTPAMPTELVIRIPPYGTPWRFIRAAKRGAAPATAIDRKVRPVAYRPAFRLDIAAVSTTRFMTSPACGIPIELITVTNGLSLGEYAVHGSSSVNRTTEPA